MTTDLDTDATDAYARSMDARLARLEAHTERNTEELRFLRGDMAALRGEFTALRSDMTSEFRDARAAAQRQFYWLLGAIGGFAGLMAHAAHWL